MTVSAGSCLFLFRFNRLEQTGLGDLVDSGIDAGGDMVQGCARSSRKEASTVLT